MGVENGEIVPRLRGETWLGILRGLSRDSEEEARETESTGHSPSLVKVGGLEYLVIGVGPGSHLSREKRSRAVGGAGRRNLR